MGISYSIPKEWGLQPLVSPSCNYEGNEWLAPPAAIAMGCADDWMAGGPGRCYPRDLGWTMSLQSTATMSSSVLPLFINPRSSWPIKHVAIMGLGITLPTKLGCQPLSSPPSLSRILGGSYFRPSNTFLTKTINPLSRAIISNVFKRDSTSIPHPKPHFNGFMDI